MRRLGMISIVAGLLLAAAAPTWADEAFPRGDRLGFSLGTPSGLNLDYSHEFGRRAVFLSGGYWGSDLYGAHGGFTLERGGTERKHFSVNLVGGYFHLVDDDKLTKWGYGGAEAYFRYRAFFIAPAFTIGSGRDENAKADGAAFLGRLGFLWRI